MMKAALSRIYFLILIPFFSYPVLTAHAQTDILAHPDALPFEEEGTAWTHGESVISGTGQLKFSKNVGNVYDVIGMIECSVSATAMNAVENDVEIEDDDFYVGYLEVNAKSKSTSVDVSGCSVNGIPIPETFSSLLGTATIEINGFEPATGDFSQYKLKAKDGNKLKLKLRQGTVTATPGPPLHRADRYIDHGDGTVTDQVTGLMWQQTDSEGGLTGKQQTYAWTNTFPTGTAPIGTAFVVFLVGLNSGTASSHPADCEIACIAGPTTGGYAGHNDWRIPLIEELTTIVDCSNGPPCIDQLVFGPTAETVGWCYWSASTGDDSDLAWVVCSNGNYNLNLKGTNRQVRAVRGGS